jgi:hypothetical protein
LRGESPPEIALENVQFYQAHESELQELIEQSGSMGCDGQEDETDDDSGWDEDEAWDEDDESDD